MERERHPEFTIRSPQITDAESINQMHATSWEDTYVDETRGVTLSWIQDRNQKWRFSPEGLARRIDMIKESHNDPAYLFMIATDQEGEVVGLVDGRKEADAQWLLGLYTKKNTYGSGLGKRLMREFDGWADDAVPSKLEVAKYNSRAIRFYEKQGFTVVPDSDHLFADKIETIEMIRQPKKGDNDEI
jgi:ribosomal protein S18 acetylase RimI-like enzyme